MTRRKDDKGRVLKEGETQRSDGTYMFRYYDATRRRKTVYAKTLNDLRKKEQLAHRDMANGIIGCDKTLNEMFYVAHNSNVRLCPHVRSMQEQSYNCWVANTWLGQKRVDSIVKSDIIRFYQEKREQGLSDGSIRRIHLFVSCALNFAVEDDLIRKNCAKHCDRPYQKKNIGHALTELETKKFLETADSLRGGEHYNVAIKLMLYTGMRVGETVGLTWKDVDLKNRVIDINHQFLQGDKNSLSRYHIGKPKTEKSVRKIPISSKLHEVLTDWRAKTYKHSMQSGVTIDGYSGFVVCTSSGMPVQPPCLNQHIHHVIDVYNSTHEDSIRQSSCHTFRHTFCTRLAEQGINPKALQRLMGHSSYRTTFDIYINTDDDFTIKEFYRIDNMTEENL